MKAQMIKPPAELQYAKELEVLKAQDSHEKPASWSLSPRAVRTFILGSEKPLLLGKEKVEIRKKFFGDDILVEQAIVTLAGNRGLMLIGTPGTAKTMLSELLSAAISGVSTNTVQGTAGTTEDMIKYSWNYAMLLDKGPGLDALVPAPLYVGMKNGIITRFEEITRAPQEVQDSLISVLSDKVLQIPELGHEGFLFAEPGFNIIATANTKDRGVNDMSNALKRRLNFLTIKPISDLNMEMTIIEQEVNRLLTGSGIKHKVERDVLKVLSTTFHELRNGVSIEGSKIDSPDAVMSTAEAVSVYYQSAINAYYYDNNSISMERLVQNITGTVLKENNEDIHKLKGYFSVIVKKRSTESSLWNDFYNGKKWIS